MVMDGCWISGGGGGKGGQHSRGQALYFLTIFQKTLGELNHMLNEGLKSANSP